MCFRGLKSFRTSPWDPKIDLPSHYSRIFEFESFAHAAKISKKEVKRNPSTVPVNAYVNLVLKDVPKEICDALIESAIQFHKGNKGPVFAVGLLQHEVKMSILHYRVTKASDYSEPIANKERFLFISGFRWFHTAPLFSTDDPRSDFFIKIY